MISHPSVIQYPIEHDYTAVKFFYENLLVKAELHQKVLLRLSVHELHIYMKKK